MTRANCLLSAKVINLVRFLVVSRPSPEQLDWSIALLPRKSRTEKAAKRGGDGARPGRQLSPITKVTSGGNARELIVSNEATH